MRHTDGWLIENSTPNCRWESRPVQYSARSLTTSAAVNFAIPLRSPRGILSGCVTDPWVLPCAARPFTAISLLLSSEHPRNKWLGRTQEGVSQWWQISRLGGIGPYVISQESRCAENSRRLVFQPPVLSTPYPPRRFLPVHSQQVSVFDTINQNLLDIGTLIDCPNELRSSIDMQPPCDGTVVLTITGRAS